MSVYVHILPKPHINVEYFLNENEKKDVLYFEENEKAVFDIIILWLLIFFMKQKRGSVSDISLYCNTV